MLGNVLVKGTALQTLFNEMVTKQRLNTLQAKKGMRITPSEVYVAVIGDADNFIKLVMPTLNEKERASFAAEMADDFTAQYFTSEPKGGEFDEITEVS